LAVFAHGLDKLLGDGTATDLIEVFYLGEKLAAAGVELGDGGWGRHDVVLDTTLSREKKGGFAKASFLSCTPTVHPA
jgi:hypothetical protein